MAFDSVLNILWLLLGLVALAATLRITFRKNANTTRRRGWQSCAIVALIAATLFPVFSATDDLLRIESIARHQHAGDIAKDKPLQKPVSDTLIKLYEAMDMPLIAVVSELLLALLFICLVRTLLQRGIERENPSASGRSPPALVCF